MLHRRKSGIQEHHQSPGSRTGFHRRKLLLIERGIDILVWLGGWIQMALLEMAKRVYNYGERLTSTLVH